jgi:peptidyl-prolyl cis-trans isomerase SurA
MTTMTKRLAVAALAGFIGFAGLSGGLSVQPAAASEIRYVVNGTPITSYDIQRRAAFLKLQRRGGGAAQAAEDMIDQTVRASELKRMRVNISDEQLNDAYNRFAAGNKLKPAQMDQILSQSGVTKSHFKEFMRVQMGWGQLLQSRSRGTMTEQDVVRKMLQQGGEKPSATEYMLQQVIFVVPDSERKASIGKRKREAEAMRGRFSNCGNTREFAKGLLDVTVRDLGKFIGPELPPDWAEAIKATKVGGATPVRETPRGVEFIGICSSREVSDDRVAQMVFQSEAQKGDGAEDQSKKLTEELRKKAKIVKR